MKYIVFLLLFASAAVAERPPQAPTRPKQAPKQCPIDGCQCGCADGGQCTCSKFKREGARDGKWIWTNEDGGYWYEWLQPVAAAPKYDHYFPPEAHSQWAARQVQPQPQFFARPMQSFGGFGGGGGMRGCSGGG